MKKALALRLAALSAAAATGTGSVMAAVPAAVSTGIADLGVDGATIATAILVAIVAVFAIKFLRKGF